MIEPKEGEHPLATKCRKLHAHLSSTYIGLAFLSLHGALSGAMYSSPWFLVGGVPAAWFAVRANEERRWSK